MSEEKKTVELNDEELEQVSGGNNFFAHGNLCSSFSRDDDTNAGNLKSCTRCKYFNSSAWLYSCSLGKTPDRQK